MLGGGDWWFYNMNELSVVVGCPHLLHLSIQEEEIQFDFDSIAFHYF